MNRRANPAVSVVVSCYNAERWLREALDSVLTQTFSDLELIVVDDGSTDQTGDIIENYRQRDDRVVAIRKANTGLTSSLNHGLSVARAEWVARIDADDTCEPTRIEEQIRFVRSHPQVVLLGTGFTEIDSDGSPIKTHSYPSTHRRLVWHLEHLARFFPHSSAFFRLREARKVNGYNVRFQRAQDWRLWLDLAMLGRLACLRKPLVRIRKHSGQISLTSNGTRQIFDAMAGTVGHLLRKAGFADPSVQGTDSEWLSFLQWIEAGVRQSGLLERQGRWSEARSRLFSESGFRGSLAFGTRLVSSGHAVASLREHLFGLSLPQRLARQWIKTQCVAS